MISTIRLIAGMITFAGAALLLSAQPAHSTMILNPLEKGDDGGKRYCCAVDLDGDRRSETLCCFATGCSINATGCRRVTAEQ